MNDEQINQIANAVVDRLATSDKLAVAVAAKLNGHLSGIREDMDKIEAKIDGVATDLKKLRRELTGLVDDDFPPLRVVP